MGAFVDIVGMMFGWLLVLSRAENRNGQTMWFCRCKREGRNREIVVSGGHLKNGHTKSCGCLHKEITAQRNRDNAIHGLSNTRAYKAWGHMMDRCCDKKNKYYHRYGGRGICVCERWQDKEKFCSDMGECPPGMDLDREKNAGGYWCGKCDECLANGWVFNGRWVTRLVNVRNRSNTRRMWFEGILMPIAEVSKKTGINYSTILYRLRHGWSDHDAATVPVGQKRPKQAEAAK